MGRDFSGIRLWGDSIGKGIVFDDTRNRYVILKDNFMNRLAKAVSVPVHNYAFMGCTVVQGAEKMREDMLNAGEVAAIEFGGNDCDLKWAEVAANPEKEHLPNTPMDQFREMLQSLVARSREAGMQPALMTPPPLDAERYFKWVSRGLDADAILRYLGDVQFIYRWQERYACAVRDVALKTGSILVDLRDAFLTKPAIPDYLCVDGIHPNARGHALIADYISSIAPMQ